MVLGAEFVSRIGALWEPVITELRPMPVAITRAATAHSTHGVKIMTHATKSALVFAATALVLSACGSDTTGEGDSAGGSAGRSAGGQSGSLAAGGAFGSAGVAGSFNQAGAFTAGGTSGSPGTDTGGAFGTAGNGNGRAGATGAAGATGMGGRGGATGMGGGAAGNGSAGAPGAAGSTAGGPPANCSVAPVSPGATTQAKNLLCYLYSQYGNHVLSGQQETSWSNPGNDINWYATNGMKLPAILGGDFLYPSGTSARAIAYWAAGGISMIRYHMGAPPGADSYAGSMGSVDLAKVLTENSPENTSFKSKLDFAAAELKKMQDANAAVIFAPFHEVQPKGWFWWSKGSGAQFVSLWKYMFNYLTVTKGLKNLIWLLPTSGSPSAEYNPGKAFYDLAGGDTYGNNQPFTSLYSQSKSIWGSTVPIPLHETGLIPTPSQMFPTAAPWIMFNIWAGYQSDGTHNSAANIKNVYADAHVVTRDEVPNLK